MAPASAPLPAPVCPQGVLSAGDDEAVQEEPPGPGESPLDDGLADLRNETVGFILGGEWVKASVYVLVSVVAGIAGTVIALKRS